MEEDNNSVETEMEIDDEDNPFPTPIAILDGKYHLFLHLLFEAYPFHYDTLSLHFHDQFD